MQEDEFAEESATQRRAIITAIILAIAVAGVIWYFFILDRPGLVSEEAGNETENAEQLQIAEDAEEGFTPFAASTPTPIPRVNGGVQDDKRPQDVSASAPTGTGEFALVLAVAATLSGTFGWRSFTKSR